jgi:putative ATP-dependent endonuclease of OLD family
MGASNAYLVCTPQDASLDYLKINLTYDYRNGRSPSFNYFTGAEPGQKAEIKNFELFQHYYLSPLRNSTRDLLNNRNNVLSNLLMRRIGKSNTQKNFEDIIFDANTKLLEQPDITLTRGSINSNLEKIFQKYPENNVGLQIEQSKIDNVINLIKPYLPFDLSALVGKAFHLNKIF